MAQRESELKYELSPGAHQRLLELCPRLDPVTEFSNLYFQAAEPVGRRDWVLRLRQWRDGLGELTLKIGLEVSPGMFCSTEYNAQVTSEQPQAWEGTEPYQVFLQQVSPVPPKLQGVARNRRFRLQPPFGPGPVWELDQLSLPDGTIFHELEIEWEPDDLAGAEEVAAFQEELEGWLRTNQLGPVRPSRKTKYRRFLDALSPEP